MLKRLLLIALMNVMTFPLSVMARDNPNLERYPKEKAQESERDRLIRQQAEMLSNIQKKKKVEDETDIRLREQQDRIKKHQDRLKERLKKAKEQRQKQEDKDAILQKLREARKYKGTAPYPPDEDRPLPLLPERPLPPIPFEDDTDASVGHGTGDRDLSQALAKRRALQESLDSSMDRSLDRSLGNSWDMSAGEYDHEKDHIETNTRLRKEYREALDSYKNKPTKETIRILKRKIAPLMNNLRDYQAYLAGQSHDPSLKASWNQDKANSLKVKIQMTEEEMNELMRVSEALKRGITITTLEDVGKEKEEPVNLQKREPFSLKPVAPLPRVNDADERMLAPPPPPVNRVGESSASLLDQLKSAQSRLKNTPPSSTSSKDYSDLGSLVHVYEQMRKDDPGNDSDDGNDSDWETDEEN